MSVGDRLRELRKAIQPKMTQENFGKIFGLKLSTYAQYERETRKIPPLLLKEFAEYHQVSVDYLLTGKTSPDTIDLKKAKELTFGNRKLSDTELIQLQKYVEYVLLADEEEK